MPAQNHPQPPGIACGDGAGSRSKTSQLQRFTVLHSAGVDRLAKVALSTSCLVTFLGWPRPFRRPFRGLDHSAAWRARGGRSRVTFQGDRLADVEEILLSQPGFEVKSLNAGG